MPHGPFTRAVAGRSWQHRVHPGYINELQEALEDTPTMAETATNESIAPLILYNRYTKQLADYASLAAAIDDLPDAGVNGGEILVDGEVTASGSFVVPANVHLIGRGAGASALRLPPGINLPLIDINGASRTVIADMTLIKEAGVTSGSSWSGVLIRGASEDVLLERVRTDGFVTGIRAVTQGGTMPIKRLTLRDCRGDNSALSHGIEISNTEYALIDNCGGTGNEDDGLKIGERTIGVTIRGGVYTGNGEEGIDAFAGGDTLLIDGPVCDDNAGYGIVVKTDTIGESDPARYGRVRNIQISNPICRNNGVHGLGIYTFPYGDTSNTDVAHATVIGGLYEGNTNSGIWIDGRNIAITAPIVRRNQQHGILVDVNSLYVTISNPVVIANSQQAANTYNGIYLRGKHMAVRGGTIQGVDADDVDAEADLASLTKMHAYNVRVDGLANYVYVDVDFSDYGGDLSGGGVTRSIRSDMTSGECIIHQRSATGGIPPTAGYYGGPGSTVTLPNQTNIQDRRWINRSGAPNAGITGWYRDADPTKVTTLPTAVANLKGAMLVKDNAGVGDDTLHVCVQTGASTYAWKQVTVT